MKIIILAALLAVTYATEDVRNGQHISKIIPYIYEDKVLELLEKCREILRNGLPDSGIPPLDPLRLHNRTIDLDKFNIENLSGKLKLDNFLFTGLSSWNVTKIKNSATLFPPGVRFELSMEWELQELTGQHHSNLTLYGQHYDTNGTVDAKVVRMGIRIDGHASLLGKVSIRTLIVSPTVNATDVNITGVRRNGVDVSEEISAFLSNLAPWIKEHQADINVIVSEFLLKILNDLLSKQMNYF